MGEKKITKFRENSITKSPEFYEKMAEENRTKRFNILFTPIEMDLIGKSAIKHGLSISQFIVWSTAYPENSLEEQKKLFKIK